MSAAVHCMHAVVGATLSSLQTSMPLQMQLVTTTKSMSHGVISLYYSSLSRNLLPDTATATCSLSQEFQSCCPKANTFGPDGPFAPKSASEYYYGSRSGREQPGAAVQWPSAAHPVQPSLVAYCNWTEPYVDDTFVPTPDLTTGVAPVAYVDGTWWVEP